MEPIDVRALEEAVGVFYTSGSVQHAQAHDWLTKVQTSPQAWSFVWDLMKPEKPSEIQFFGATTLHSKLIKHWAEVPKENYEELKQKLMDTIILFGNGPRITLNRLCISLSAFIVQMYADWPSAVEDVSQSLQTHQLPNIEPKMQIWIMMEILCAIPDEAMAITTSVQRAAMRNDLSMKAPYVLNVLEKYLETKCGDCKLDTQDLETLTVAAKCASAWLRNYTFPLDTCVMLASSMVKLVTKCYWESMTTDGCLSAEENELTEWCLETLTSMLIQPEAHRYSANALFLMQLFLDTLTPITTAENVEDNQNEDIVSAIYTLFVTSIEAHSRALINGVISDSPQHQQIFHRLVAQMLQCTDKPGIYPVEESCSSIAMGFWYMLQDEVLSSDSEPGRTKMVQLIAPIYAHLARVLVRKSQQPDEEQLDKWSADDLEMFRCYRQDIADTLLYCYEVLQDDLLLILTDMLKHSAALLNADLRNWTVLESCVHAFCAVSEQIDCDERRCTTELFSVLKTVPFDRLNEKLLGMALETIGAYSEWFKFNVEYLPHAIELLVCGLNSSQASQATLGLKDICSECQAQLKDYCEPLLNACQVTLDSGKMQNSECVRLMFSIGKLMSMLPEEKLMPSLDALVSPCFSELQAIMQVSTHSGADVQRVLFRMNMIATLFTSLNTNPEVTKLPSAKTGPPAQPVLFVIEKTMPIFKAVGVAFINDSGVMEALCHALRHAVTNLQNDFMPMLPELCGVIVTLLQARCLPSLVDLTRTCVVFYYREKRSTETMRQLHVEVNACTLRLLDATPTEKISDHTDLVESFYSFNTQVVKKLPEAYVNPGIDNTKLLMYATRALAMPEQTTLKHAVMFVVHYITQSSLNEVTATTVRNCGASLVRMVMDCIGVLTPRAHVDLFADILLALSKKYANEFRVWMKLLDQSDYPSPLVTVTEKQLFVTTIVKEKTNKRIIQAQIKDFAAKCRGLPPLGA